MSQLPPQYPQQAQPQNTGYAPQYNPQAQPQNTGYAPQMQHAAPSHPPRRLSGGSAALDESENYFSGPLGMFGQDVDWVMPGKHKQGMQQRILPAHSSSLDPASPEWPMSYMPYRDPNSVNQETGQEPYTPWFALIRAYRMLGNGKFSFVSPITYGPEVPEAERVCPMVLLRNHCRNIPELKHLTESPPKEQQRQGDKYAGPWVPQAKTLAIYNVLAMWATQPAPKNYLGVLTQSGFEFILQQTGLPMPQFDGRNPVDPRYVDPNWPRYMLGDITDPNRGLGGYVAQQKIQNSGAEPWTLMFLGDIKGGSFTGFTPAPIGALHMQNRYDLLDMQNTVLIHSFQKIVDVMLADGWMPREIIARACGHMADCHVGEAQPTFQAAVTGFVQQAPFGAQPAFGQPAQQAPFGAQPAFGQPAQQAPFGAQPAFGQPAQAPFGQPAQQAPFGAQPAFGQPAQQAPFGAQPAFGQPAQAPFGQPAQPAFGQPAQAPFGQPAQQAPFGAQPAFGQPAQQAPQVHPAQQVAYPQQQPQGDFGSAPSTFTQSLPAAPAGGGEAAAFGVQTKTPLTPEEQQELAALRHEMEQTGGLSGGPQAITRLGNLQMKEANQ